MTRQAPKMRGMIRLATAALALALAGAPAVAQKRDGADIGEKQQDLQQTQKRLNEERQKAADAKKREAGLLAELESIDKRVTDKRKQVVTLDGRIKKAQADIGDFQADIGKLGRQRLGQEEVLERRLRALSTSSRPRAERCPFCSPATIPSPRQCSSGISPRWPRWTLD